MGHALRSFVVVLFFCRMINAEFSVQPRFRARWFARPLWRQYVLFYDKADLYFGNTSSTTCNATLNIYNEAFDAPYGSDSYQELLSACYQHESCILEQMTKDTQANFQSADVMLGLMPTLLTAIAPSIAEISLLSAHRPFLSFLLSMGAPGIWPTRILTYQEASSALFGETDNRLRSRLMIKSRPAIGTAISMAQYIAALGAIANVIMTSIGVGQKTILSWGCTTQFLPLVWALMPCVVHALAVLGYLLTKSKSSQAQLSQNKSLASLEPVKPLTFTNTIEDPSATVGDNQSKKLVQNKKTTTKSTTMVRAIYGFLVKEVTTCVNQTCRCLEGKRNASMFATLITLTAGGLASFHVVFGVMIFSSLQLISIWDVANMILWRYVISTVICRIILIIELAGIRRHGGDESHVVPLELPKHQDDSSHNTAGLIALQY